jgi:hypothetical protein
VDIDTPSGREEYNQVGIQGVPVIKSDKSGKIHVGYTEDVAGLINKLN